MLFKIRINLLITAPKQNLLSFICISIFLPINFDDTTIRFQKIKNLNSPSFCRATQLHTSANAQAVIRRKLGFPRGAERGTCIHVAPPRRDSVEQLRPICSPVAREAFASPVRARPEEILSEHERNTAVSFHQVLDLICSVFRSVITVNVTCPVINASRSCYFFLTFMFHALRFAKIPLLLFRLSITK